MSVGTLAPVPENPLVEGLERLPVRPTCLVIFGGTGDLARRKLMPAIYNLAHDGALPEHFGVVGVARSELSDEQFREEAAQAIRSFSRRTPDERVLELLLEEVFYVMGGFDDPEVYEELALVLARLDREAEQPLNRLHYLSTAPSFFALIVRQLGEHELDRVPSAEVRVVVEKPFGSSLQEARELNHELLSVLDESQIFRIDHYLGKETVQNLLALRFANNLFEPVWNRRYVDHVQITMAEDIGIGGRGGYYDGIGAARDVLQNHLLQLLALTAMEEPVSFDAEALLTEKLKVLKSVQLPNDLG